MKKYATPDFDVTVYEIKDVLTNNTWDDNDEWSDSLGYYTGGENN